MSALITPGKKGAEDVLHVPLSVRFAGKEPWTDVTAPRTSTGALMGADPTGVASANTAISNAAAFGGALFFPQGTYKISANLTVSNDIVLSKGASFSIAAGITLTLTGNIDTGLQQIFTGSGVVSFAGGKTAVVYPHWWGAVADGATDDLLPLRAAVVAAQTNAGKVHLAGPGFTYRITDQINITGAVSIEGGGAKINQTATTKRAFYVTVSNVTFENIRIQGPHNSGTLPTGIYGVANSSGIEVVGTPGTQNGTILDVDPLDTAPTYIENVVIRNCEISWWGRYGIRIDYCKSFAIINNYIHDITYAGILGYSMLDARIQHNFVRNIVADTQAYGIAMTKSEGREVPFPRSTRVNCCNNLVHDVLSWEGIDTHGGRDLVVSSNGVYHCKVGIAIVDCDGPDPGVRLYGPQNVSVTGNVINSGVTDGSAQEGITFTGASGLTGAVDGPEDGTGSITGNTVIGYGTDDASLVSAGIYVRNTAGLVIAGNNVVECSPIGINLYHHNKGAVVTGNGVKDTWANTASSAYAIATRGNANTAYVGGNSITRGTKTATVVNGYGIRFDGSGNTIDLAPNHNEGTVVVQDGSNFSQLRSNAKKLGFFSVSPITRPTATTDIKVALSNLGLLTAGGASPLDLEGGLLKAGSEVVNASSLDASAVFEIVSTTKGFLPPRMTAAQRDAISAPATGLTIYNTDTNKLNYYYSAAWHIVPDETGDILTQYVLLAGRAGGQTVYGGTASADPLTIHSTSHATKGVINVGPGSVFDASGGLTIQPTVNAAVLQIKSFASGTSDILGATNGTGTLTTRITSTGAIICSVANSLFGSTSGLGGNTPTVTIKATAVARTGLATMAMASQTGPIQEWQDSGGTAMSKVGPDGRFYIKSPATAPTDADIMVSGITFYLDEAGNNLKVRVKYAGGTLKTATVALV